MSSFSSWVNKYRYSTTRGVWTLIARAAFRYAKRTEYIGKEPRFDVIFDLDEILCPELIFNGFINIVADYTTIQKELQDENYYTEKWEPEGTGYSVLKEYRERELALLRIIDELESLLPNPIKTNRPLKEVMESFENGIEKRALRWISEVFGYKKYDGSDVSLYDFADWFDELLDYRLTLDMDREFSKSLGRFLKVPFKNKKETVISPLGLVNFCVDYLTHEREEKTKIKLSKISEDYADLIKELSAEVVCQDTAIRKFVQGLFNGELRNEDNLTGPQASFLFVGPPGVGKTFLAKSAAKYLDRPVKVFQMNEYAQTDSFRGLIGFEETYKNSKPGDLTAYVERNDDAILIFDEIEKAHINTIRLFLSVLEGGKLRDLYTQSEADFTHTIVIFTTNAGRKFYEDKRDIPLSSMSENTLLDALRDEKYNEDGARIPSELLSRLAKGNIIGFDHMNPAKLVPIIKRGMKAGDDIVMEKMGVECVADESVLPYIFLFHMGAKLDARVASARSESFIKDALYQLAERMGEGSVKEFKKLKKNTENIKVHFEVEDSKLAKELTVPPRNANIIIVCNQEDLNNLIFARKDKYNLYHTYAEKKNNTNYKDYITQQIMDHDIDAILVDPFMRGISGKKKKEALIGVVHKNTRGMEVIEWLAGQDMTPPVYCLELKKDHPISYLDKQELQKKGVRDVVRLSEAKNKEGRTKMIEDLVYELFLASKLERLTSKGRAVDYEIGHVIETSEILDEKDPDKSIARTKGTEANIRLVVNNLRLVRSMDPEAQEIFIDDSVIKSEGFDSVIGAEGAKEELRHFLELIEDPKKYRKSGRQASKGLLMYGPPGTGKTKLARALACEADCPFISVTGSQLLSGDKKVSDIFYLARKYAPSVVFIDEIESIADVEISGNPIVKSLLTEMDGFSKTDKPVFVIAATNDAGAPNLGEQNIYLDPALLRRFTKKVYMKYPTREERIKFMKRQQASLKGKAYNLDSLKDKDLKSFADLTVGRSLAEMENVLSLAIGRAADNDGNVTIALLTTCFEESIYGEEHKYSQEHIRITALHEAGHAYVGFVCDAGKKSFLMPEYATIISRGGYLGMVQRKDDEELTGYSRQDLLNLIRVSLAGRASEMVFASDKDSGLTTGASNDLEKASHIAQSMLSRFGMEDGFLVSMPMQAIMQSTLAEKYLNKLNEIIERELQATIDIIKKDKDKVEALADALLDRSRLDTEEMKEILGIK